MKGHSAAQDELGQSDTQTPSKASLAKLKTLPTSSVDYAKHRSLKEIILLRKYNRAEKEKVTYSPSKGAKGNLPTYFESSGTLREKILENRRRLHKLLSDVPDAIVRPQQTGVKRKVKSRDLKGATTLLSFSGEKRHTAGRGSVLSQTEDSSSDEDLREPIAESPPDLSDEDSLESYQRMSPELRGIDRVSNNKVLFASVQPSRMQESDKITVSVTRTSSRSNFLINQRTIDTSPTNKLYQAAKPRPPPRFKKNNIASMRAAQMSVQDVSSKSEASNVVTLPYVSRGTCKGQLRRRSYGSYVTKDLSDVTVDESVQPRQGENTKCVDRDTDLNNKSTHDTSPTPTAVSSSGYSSPGSINGSSSLSPSTSNASSASLHSSVPLGGHAENDGAIVEEQPLSKPTTTIENKVGCSFLDDREEDSTFTQEEEDVFPITSWVESEFNNMLKRKSMFSSGSLTSEERQEDNKRLSSLSDDATHPSTSQLKNVSTTNRRPHSAYVISRSNQSNHATVGTNSVSMVEPVSPRAFKHRSQIVSGYVTSKSAMMRFPGATRSKKDAASRSSRAFAMQSSFQTDADPPPSSGLSRQSTSSSTTSWKKEVNEDRRVPPLSPKESVVNSERQELSGSFAKFHRKGSETSKGFNTVSGATGRHLSEKSSFFEDEHNLAQLNNSSSRYHSTQSVFIDSTWSLNPAASEAIGLNRVERKPSLRHRLKGAFSFQNIRKAISMERLDEGERYKSASHCYLNEFGEDISQTTKPPAAVVGSSNASIQSKLHKPPSLSSLFSTVRMRKRKSRERRAAKARNTIAVDPKQIPEYEVTSNAPKSPKLRSNDDVSTPGHFRPIGKVLEMNAQLGTVLVEMAKPSSGPMGFCLARNKDNGSVFISSLSDSYPDKMYAGLMRLGDEITEINGIDVEQLTLDQVYDVILQNDRILLRIKPSQINTV